VCAVSESGRGARIHVSHVAAARLACPLLLRAPAGGLMHPRSLARGDPRAKRGSRRRAPHRTRRGGWGAGERRAEAEAEGGGGGEAGEDGGVNLKAEISWWQPRPGPARETVVSCDGYFDPVAFVYCVGFWGSVHFFRLSRNGYFKIESRPDARLTLPRPNTRVLRGVRARSCARVARRRGFAIPTEIATDNFGNENRWPER